MKCALCHGEKSQYKLKPIQIQRDKGRVLEGLFCHACFDRAKKMLATRDLGRVVINAILTANGITEFKCEACGQEKAGEPMYMEIPDRDDGDAMNDLMICHDCNNKIWDLIHQLRKDQAP